MKNNRIILSLVGSSLLIGCNNNNYDKIRFATINDTEATETINAIKETQKAETFSIPNKFTIETNQNMSASSFDYNTGESDYKMTVKKIDKFDLDNLKAYKYIYESRQSVNLSNESTIEVYMFYDADLGVLYNLRNSNGCKERTEEQMSKEEAVEAFKQSKYLADYDNRIMGTTYLSDFDLHLEGYHILAEEYKDKPDESYSYSFGSEDKKSSFQDLLKGHLKTTELITGQEGFDDRSTNRIFKDNKMLYLSNNRNINTTAPNDKNLWKKEVHNENVTYKYDVADISIPNISDYKI